MNRSMQRRLSVGAEPCTGGVRFRVWAPLAHTLDVVLESAGSFPLDREEDGYFSGLVAAAATGSRYRYRIDGDKQFPDPASRYQPEGPHGPSEVVDPSAFRWSDSSWRGVKLPGQVIYELHLGTFTSAGTWAAAMTELPELANIGITVVEIMPVSDFTGRWGWGYDGVDLFAPTRLYGTPDDMRQFVDRAHGVGIAVILDVVYNHLGPDGNYLGAFSKSYFTDRYKTDWGAAINFDGPDSGPVREFFLANAAYWIEEFHLDGLRLDATQNIYDETPDHILAAIGRRVRLAARNRDTILVAENEPQNVQLIRPTDKGGYGLDGIWNDDFHHSARVALTGRSEAYYGDYRGSPQEFISAAKYGFLYQGQHYSWQNKPRGTPAFGFPPAAFVTFIQNHDQLANSGSGQRIHELTSPGRYRALTALFLLGPGTPLLFQGQEFASTSPFLFFADHPDRLAGRVARGRLEFLSQFPSLKNANAEDWFCLPGDQETFTRCKLDFSERQRHSQAYALHRDLLHLRRSDPVFSSRKRTAVDGAVLGDSAFVIRFFGTDGDDRLLLVNLGRDLHIGVVPETLLAPPVGRTWRLLWTSESPRYGTGGTPAVEGDDGWHLPGESAIVLT